jgi:hypothetical protein
MKVLFAVSNEEISENIVKKYQREYKEIISYKNVYYFNAILKELQKDKTYDRIVISEDLENFTSNQYDQIDKFIFEKLDSISDEASNYQGDNIPIILICADRRTKSEQMLIKLFGISIYDALLGPDRNIDELCKLINKPRSKKEAKIYYKIDSEDVNYKPENENDVSEVEIQNILAHYKRLGKNEEKYLESFDNIASQYNDVQLRIICKFLPLNVRAVLEEKSPKYQKVMSFNSKVTDKLRKGKHNEEANGTSEKLLKTVNTKETLLSKPVVIPNAVNLQNTKKLTKPKPVEEKKEEEDPLKQIEREINTYVKNENGFVQTQQTKTTKQEENLRIAETEEKTEEVESKPAPKRGRGRPRKNPLPEEDAPKKKRGRPKKNTEDENQLQIQDEEDLIMPGIEETTKQEENLVMPGLEEEQEENIIMPGLEEKAEELGMKETIEPKENEIRPINTIGQISKTEQTINTEIDISSLLTGNKKLACFVGTSKNGTSFIVNNVAQILSTHGISTAILDLTQNRNSYYVYTNNIEDLRNTAIYCFQNLINGNPKGIQANKNLTVYTSLPDDNEIIENAGEILQTLVKNYSVVLIDCDFKTPLSYFSYAQEIYLVQSMDVLTIQPLTSFLNELRSKNILDEKKLRIILNKVEKLKKASEKVIIGGMSSYNDPAMTYMVELFDKNLIKYISIPFDEQVYVKYLDGLIDCEISLKGYPKNIIQILTELANMIYKNTAGTTSYRPPTVNGNGFSPSINSTLEQMRKY